MIDLVDIFYVWRSPAGFDYITSSACEERNISQQFTFPKIHLLKIKVCIHLLTVMEIWECEGLHAQTKNVSSRGESPRILKIAEIL